MVIAIACPWFYFDAVRPCVSCFNFEAAVTHEIGLALGLAQPDVPSHADTTMAKPINSTNCDATHLMPWEWGSLTKYGTPDASYTGGIFGRVMDHLETRRSQPCPTMDDIQGLN